MKREHSRIPDGAEQDRREYLDALLTPITSAEFFSQHWDRKALHIRGDERKLKALFPGGLGRTQLLEILDRVAGHDRSSYEASVFPAAYEVEGFESAAWPQLVMDPISTVDMIVGGVKATINIHYLEHYDARVLAFFKNLRQQLGVVPSSDHTVFFVHAPGGPGFALHYDHCGIVQVMLEGHKTWRISAKPVEPWPWSSSYSRRDKRIEITADGWQKELAGTADLDLIELETGPGDVLYMPAGTLHTTRSGQEASLGLSYAFYPARFPQVLKKVMDIAFMQQAPWRSMAPAVGDIAGQRGRDATKFIAARIGEARSFLADLRPEDPLFVRSCQQLRARRLAYLAPELRTRALHRKPLSADDRLIVPLDAPLTLADCETPEKTRVLYIYYGDEEVCFDEPRFFDFARSLVRQSSFRAGDSVKWVRDGNWSEIQPMLETLVEMRLLGLAPS